MSDIVRFTVSVEGDLLEAFDDYIAFFKAYPDTTLKNIVFGDLNRYEWNLFHRKHYNHHFEQFGLL